MPDTKQPTAGTFEEWWDSRTSGGASDFRRDCAEEGWNAAIASQQQKMECGHPKGCRAEFVGTGTEIDGDGYPYPIPIPEQYCLVCATQREVEVLSQSLKGHAEIIEKQAAELREIRKQVQDAITEARTLCLGCAKKETCVISPRSRVVGLAAMHSSGLICLPLTIQALIVEAHNKKALGGTE